MSHVAEIPLEIRDLDALEIAARKLGLEVKRGQKTYKSYQGRLACEHALVQPDNPNGWEIGVVKRQDGKGYALMWDSYAQGHGLVQKVGHDAGKVQPRYSPEVGAKKARFQGFRVTEKFENGKIRLRCTR